MAYYRTVSMNFWTDPKVDDEFTPEDKYFYLYLITNPHTNICGCYEVGKRQAERELGYTWDAISRLIDRMTRVHNVIRYSEETKEILLVNWGRYNWTRSGNTSKAVYSCCDEIKNERFRAYIKQQADHFFYPQKQNTETVPVTVTVTDGTKGYGNPLQGASNVDKSSSYPQKYPHNKNRFVNYKQRDIDYDALLNQMEGHG